MRALALVASAGIAVGALAGTAGARVASALVVEKRDAAQAGWRPVEVLVARTELPGMTELSDEQLEVRTLPEQFVTEATVLAARRRHVVGAKLLLSLPKGAPLRWTHFAKPMPVTACDELTAWIAGSPLTTDDTP